MVFTLKSGVEALSVGISGPAFWMCLRPSGGNQALAFRDDLLSERLISHRVQFASHFSVPEDFSPSPFPQALLAGQLPIPPNPKSSFFHLLRLGSFSHGPLDLGC